MNMAKAILLTLAITLIPTYGFSFSSHPDRHHSKDKRYSYQGHYHGGEYCKKDHSDEAETVPEINAGGTAIALALLAGLVLVTRERKSSDRG